MQQNIGGAERTIRFVIGIALLSLVLFLDGGARWFGLLGLIPIITASVRWCPLWTIFKINTNK